MGDLFLPQRLRRLYFSKPEKYQKGFLSGTTFPTPSCQGLRPRHLAVVPPRRVQGLAVVAAKSQRSVGKQVRFADAAENTPSIKVFHAAYSSGSVPNTPQGTLARTGRGCADRSRPNWRNTELLPDPPASFPPNYHQYIQIPRQGLRRSGDEKGGLQSLLQSPEKVYSFLGFSSLNWLIYRRQFTVHSMR